MPAKKKVGPARKLSPAEVEKDRIEREAKSGAIANATEPMWLNPKEPLPPELRTGSAKRTIIDEAMGIFPDVKNAVNAPSLLAAVIVAQALDRLGNRMVEAAAISRRIG